MIVQIIPPPPRYETPGSMIRRAIVSFINWILRHIGFRSRTTIETEEEVEEKRKMWDMDPKAEDRVAKKWEFRDKNGWHTMVHPESNATILAEGYKWHIMEAHMHLGRKTSRQMTKLLMVSKTKIRRKGDPEQLKDSESATLFNLTKNEKEPWGLFLLTKIKYGRRGMKEQDITGEELKNDLESLKILAQTCPNKSLRKNLTEALNSIGKKELKRAMEDREIMRKYQEEIRRKNSDTGSY